MSKQFFLVRADTNQNKQNVLTMSNKAKKITGSKLPLRPGSYGYEPAAQHKNNSNTWVNRITNQQSDVVKSDRSAIQGSNSPWLIKICLN